MSDADCEPVVPADGLDADGQPIWDRLAFDPTCSRCGYNLRLLTAPRCPECALEFAWADVIAAQANRNPFLFEHNWRRRPVRSLAATIWRGLRPATFWQQVSIHDRLSPGPLWFLSAATVAALFLGVHATALLGWGALRILTIAVPTWSAGQTASSLMEELWYQAVAPLAIDVEYAIAVLTVSAFVAGSLCFLCGLRQTLGRARVQTRQVLRAFAYSAPPAALVLGALNVPWLELMYHWDFWSTLGYELAPLVFIVPPLAVVAVLGAYTGAGLRHYLHLPRPYALACASGLAGLLASCLAVILVSLFLR